MTRPVHELIGARIALRPWRPTDAEALYALASDPEVAGRTGFPVHKSVEDSRRVIREVFSASACYAITLREGGVVVGCIQTFAPGGQSVYEAAAVEVGFWLGRSHWGRGLMTESLALLCAAQRPASSGFAYERLVGRTRRDNAASQHVLEKCLFTQCGEENGYVCYSRARF